MADTLTGGRVGYYLADVVHPKRDDVQRPYMAECEDIISALKMTFDEACEFKAIWRTAAARLGNGKPGQKAVYDAEKRVHYAQNSLRDAQIEAGTYVSRWVDPEKERDIAQRPIPECLACIMLGTDHPDPCPTRDRR